MKFQIVEKNGGAIVAFNWAHVAHVHYTPGGTVDILESDRVKPRSVSVTLIAPAQGEFGTEGMTLRFTGDDVDKVLNALYSFAAEE